MIRKGGGIFQPQTLDVDETIFDRNLRIVDGEDGSGDGGRQDVLSSLLGGDTKRSVRDKKVDRILMPDQQNLPSIVVAPVPGLCVKTKNLSDRKVFVNLCKIQEIPPAPPMTEEQLHDLIADEDYSSDFRVPMSLGAPREEKDKSGNTCLVCDVAINSVWYDEVLANSLAFTTFVIQVAMEGLRDKYGDDVNLDRQNWTILKNKKYLGSLQRQNIQQRLSSKIVPEHSESTARISELDKEPEFTIVKRPVDGPDAELLVAEILLPGVLSKSEVSLQLGEDRLVCRSTGTKVYLLDVFLPFQLDLEASCDAEFDCVRQVLTVTMPVVSPLSSKS